MYERCNGPTEKWVSFDNSLLRVYRQYIGMSYIALARQAWIYYNISDSLDTIVWIRNELWIVLQHITLCSILQCFSEFLHFLWFLHYFYNVLIPFFPTWFGHFQFHPTLELTCALILTLHCVTFTFYSLNQHIALPSMQCNVAFWNISAIYRGQLHSLGSSHLKRFPALVPTSPNGLEIEFKEMGILCQSVPTSQDVLV